MFEQIEIDDLIHNGFYAADLAALFCFTICEIAARMVNPSATIKTTVIQLAGDQLMIVS